MPWASRWPLRGPLASETHSSPDGGGGPPKVVEGHVPQPLLRSVGTCRGCPSTTLRVVPLPVPGRILAYQLPVLAMLAHGSCGSRWPSCSSSIEIPSGVLMKAICPSREPWASMENVGSW